MKKRLLCIILAATLVFSGTVTALGDPVSDNDAAEQAAAEEVSGGSDADTAGAGTAGVPAEDEVEEALPEDGAAVTYDNESDAESVQYEEEDEEGHGLGYREIEDEVEIEDYHISRYGNKSDRRLAAASYPSKYIPDVIPDLRDQGSYGTCWAHTCMALAEMSLIKQGYYMPRDIDLSELQLAYFSYNSVTDPLGGTEGDRNSLGGSYTLLDTGGNLDYAMNVLAGWTGAADEADVPYRNAGTVQSRGLDSSYAYKDKAHLTNVYTTGFDTSDLTPVKKLIVDNGAVGIAFYSNKSYYYNSTYNSYYCGYSYNANHAVTVVGWDDDFPANHFRTTAPGNGAWLVRNSWTSGSYSSNQCYEGYFWLSYYDSGLRDKVHAFSFEPSDNYDNNYQYDGSMKDYSTGYSKGANVFTAHSEGGEYGEILKAVSFSTAGTNVDYTIDVYTDLTEDGDPESGTKRDTVTGTTTYAGYYEVKLNREIELMSGDEFSVVVSLSGSNGYARLVAETNTTQSWVRTTASAKSGQSYGYSYGSWIDYGKNSSANLRIKAFTDDIDYAVAVDPTGLSFADDVETTGIDLGVSGTVAVVPVISPANANRRELIWSSSDESIATVSSKGLVTGVGKGKCTITAKTRYGKGEASCEVRVNHNLSSITIKGESTLSRGDTGYQYIVETVPLDAEVSGKVKWSSSDPEKLEIDDDGCVTIKRCGQVTIYAQLEGKTDSLDVSIELNSPYAWVSVDADNNVTISWRSVDGADCYTVTEGYSYYTDTNKPICVMYDDGSSTYSFKDTSHVKDTENQYAYYTVWAWDGYDSYSKYGKGSGVKAYIRAYDYTITYVTNGAKNSADNPKGYRKGQRIELIAPTPAAGYRSAYWCSDKALKKRKDFITTSDKGNITLYACNAEPFGMSLTSSDGSVYYEAFDMDEAYERIADYYQDNPASQASWNIKLYRNTTLGNGIGIDFGEYADRVNIDLDEHVLTIGKGGNIRAASIVNGNVNVSNAFISGENVAIEVLKATGKLDVEKGCGLDAVILNVTGSGSLYLEPESRLHIGESAGIYNLYIGQDASGTALGGGAARLTKLEDADVTINKAFKAKDVSKDRLEVCTVKETESGIAIVGTAGGYGLFRTNISKFPTELITLVQPEGFSKYVALDQIGDSVIVSANWFLLYNGTELLGSFSRWSKITEYINKLNNKNVDYRVIVKEDVTTRENLTFPNKAKSLTVMGEYPEAPVKLSYLGDLSPKTDTVFENIVLHPQSYDKRNRIYKDNPGSKINLGGKKLSLLNTYSECTFANVSGGGASVLILADNEDRGMPVYDEDGNKTGSAKMKLSVKNAVSVPTLFMTDYALRSENNALTVGKDAYLGSADIDVKTNITIKNLHSLDSRNTLSYADSSKNSFKLNGIIDSTDSEGNVTGTEITAGVRGEDDLLTASDGSAEIKANAVSIRVKYIENAVIRDEYGNEVNEADNPGKNYSLTDHKYDSRKKIWKVNIIYPDKNLVTAAKAPASYFVTGREGDAVQFATRKTGNNIRINVWDSPAVTLYLTGSGRNEILGYFDTLKEALSEIGRYGVKTNTYLLELDASKSAEITPVAKRANLSLPRQTAGITITTGKPYGAGGTNDKAVLYLNDSLNLNSELVLRNIVIADLVNEKNGTNKKLNLKLGGYRLILEGVEFERMEKDRIGNITGNGVNGSSVLALDYKDSAERAEIRANGDVSNIGRILLDNADLEATGNIKTGLVESNGGKVVDHY